MTKKKLNKKKENKERKSILIKKKKVEEISQVASKYPVVALLNIRNIPDRILQSSRKKLRDKAEFIVAKNSVIKRALEKVGKPELVKYINFPTSVVFTSLSPYSLFKFFKENKAKVAAKPGTIAPFDIVVPEGETDLPPGPALSELKGAGINAQIKGGKIVVAKDSVVAKKGAKISDIVCKALQKLNIYPFEARINMVAAYDGNNIFEASILDVDEVQLQNDFKEAISQSFNLSFNASFPTQQNISFLIQSAIFQATNMSINASIYSDNSVGMLMARAIALGNNLSNKIGNLESSSSAAPGASTGAAHNEAK